jgi:hypothetical protein
MRIRTDGEYAHREKIIEAAAERFDCNKTKAVLIACEVSGDVLKGVQKALEHPDISSSVAEEMAETISTRRVQIQVEKRDLEIVNE